MPRHLVTALIPHPVSEPTYPEYEELRGEARTKGRGPIGMQTIDRMSEVVQRRGGDWCTAVLGWSFPGLRHTSIVDGWMLILADERGLTPELPSYLVEARQAEGARRQKSASRAAAKLEAEKRRWALITGSTPVSFTVRENTRHTGVGGRLRHITADVDLLSGLSRRHKAGMGLCETPNRVNPLRLGKAIEDLPPDCRRCIEYAGHARPVGAPAPPTAAETALMQLIRSGAVFTLRPARSQPSIRDTSQRSRGTRSGALGRKVDAAVKKLEKKDWVKADAEHSATETGQYGHRWRLTEAGTAALEG